MSDPANRLDTAIHAGYGRKDKSVSGLARWPDRNLLVSLSKLQAGR